MKYYEFTIANSLKYNLITYAMSRTNKQTMLVFNVVFAGKYGMYIKCSEMLIHYFRKKSIL